MWDIYIAAVICKLENVLSVWHIADTLNSLTESDMQNPYAADMELTVEQMAYDVMARVAGLNRQKATKAEPAAEGRADAGAGADRAEPADHLPAADQKRQREISADAAAARQGSDPARAGQSGGGGVELLRALQRFRDAAGGPVAADAGHVL